LLYAPPAFVCEGASGVGLVTRISDAGHGQRGNWTNDDGETGREGERGEGRVVRNVVSDARQLLMKGFSRWAEPATYPSGVRVFGGSEVRHPYPYP
jgi:hypothetical protein